MPVPYNATGLWPSANFGDAPRYAAAARGEAVISPADRAVLRALAGRVAALAARDTEAEKREAWFALNSLAPSRPIVLVDPENGWNEIIPPAALQCSGALARRWEMVLRKELHWGENVKDDKPIEPLFEVGLTFTDSGWGVEETYHGGAGGQSYSWEGAIASPADVPRIGVPRIEVDWRTSHESLALACEVFSGILRVRVRNVWWWSLGMTWDLARLVGLETMLYLLHDNPRMVHDIMAKLRDGHLARLDWLESQGLLSLNNDHSYVGSDGIGYCRELPGPGFDPARVRTIDTWCLTESQETLGVSPAQFEEFVFPYQLRIQERFGLNCYGCCEPLDGRWHVVKKTPRLRRVSVSPWADQKKMAGFLENRYIFSRKAPPALLALPRVDEDAVRADIRATLDAARGCVLEIIMKDNHTLGGNPRNLAEWVRIAREEMEKGGG